MRHRTSLALAAGCVGCLGSTAAAAAPAAWDGVYIGLNGGGDWRKATVDSSTEVIQQATNFFVPQRGIVVVPGTTQPVPGARSTGSGGVWGGQLGVNLQSGAWVFGLEGDVGGGSGKTSTSSTTPMLPTALTPGQVSTSLTANGSTDPAGALVTYSTQRQVSWTTAWSARGRLGYAWDKFLAYGTAGVAGATGKVTFRDTWSDIPGGFAAPNALIGGPPACFYGPNFNPANCPGTANLGPLGPVVSTGSQSHRHIGWTAGLGGEVALSSAVSLGLEYQHTALGSRTYSPANPSVTDTGPALPTPGTNGQANAGPTRVTLSNDRITLRLNWRFWGPAL